MARISNKWFWIPAVITLIYGLVMLYFNAVGKIEGPIIRGSFLYD